MVGYHGVSSRPASQRHSSTVQRPVQTAQTEAARQVSERRIGRDHQVEMGHDRGGLHEVAAPAARQLDDREPPVRCLELIQAMFGLQADQPNARQLGQRREVGQSERSPPIVACARGFPARRSRSGMAWNRRLPPSDREPVARPAIRGSGLRQFSTPSGRRAPYPSRDTAPGPAASRASYRRSPASSARGRGRRNSADRSFLRRPCRRRYSGRSA